MRKKILVVEDHAPTVKLIKAALEGQGHGVITAANGAEGLLRVNDSHPDIVILDLMMPIMDGHQMLRVIRENAATEKLPVVVLTAKSSDVDVVKGWRAGISYYLTKPFSVDELLAIVNRVLSDTAPGA